MSFKNLSVKWKIILLQLAIVVPVLGLYGAVRIMNDARIYRQSIDARLASMTIMLGYNCASALDFQDGADAARTLKSLEAETQVTDAWILDAGGRVFASYRKSGREAGEPPALNGDTDMILSDALVLSRRILRDGETIGSIILRYDLGGFRKILAQNYLAAGLALIGSLGLALLLALFAHRALSVPILRLVDVIGRVSRTKDLSARIDETRRDEIGVLYTGFNDMLAEIQSREADRDRAEAALKRAHDELEQRVRERTRDLVAANDRLKELDRLKSQFLAMMSHELRTPLNSIIGFTGILKQGLSGALTAEQLKQVEIVYGSAVHLLSLINDLLDLSRIEAGKTTFQRTDFDFTAVINEVLETLKPLSQQKGLALRAETAVKSLPMTGDPKRSFQILLNLANNAIKFTNKGEVVIQAGIEGGRLQVDVRDTGIGIKEEDQGRLFAAFHQVDNSSTRVQEGTGLGLYFCRRLLGLMGGDIRVQSALGKGSLFTFTLPVTPPAEARNPNGGT